ncbi:MAG TPA: M23 family metallopeptidase [Chitinophagaceae bacterium]|nr:M23 family metallopeptidase [Chitinophagaceae bacterium]
MTVKTINRLYRFVFLNVIALSATTSLQAQVPVNYFRNPVGIPMELAANFGELRPDHWHMGLDVRTNAKENLPIYAAAEGYIAHIGVRPKSFGRFIIINHPNGLSTLYAHLNDFFPELEKYVTGQQYQKESWAVELDFSKEKFPVAKGDFIAYSGNTGGSQGPHLHFEIFETKTGKRLNPLLFNFPVSDKVSPVITRLAVYDRSKSVFDQSPVFYNLKNTDSGYIIPKTPVLKTGLSRLSFAIQAYDKMSAGGSPDGIYSAQLFVDDKPQVKFVLDSIDYNETAFINAQIDYKHRYNGGGWLQHVAKLPGDNGAAYKVQQGDGVVHLTDTLLHTVRIVVKDAKGYTAALNFLLQYDDSLQTSAPGQAERLRFAPNKVNTLTRPGFEMYLPKDALYDTTTVDYYALNNLLANAFSPAHQAGNPSIPLHSEAMVRIKLNKPVPEAQQDKLLIIRTDNKGGKTVKKAVWQEQWLSAAFGDFGTYQLVADTVAPQINAPGKGDTINLSGAGRIVFTPADNYGIKKFRATLDGAWLRFTNDKGRSWIYEFDERCPYGVHELIVNVEDIAGNVLQKSWWFKREPYTPPSPKKKAVKKTSTKGKSKDKQSGTKKKK